MGCKPSCCEVADAACKSCKEIVGCNELCPPLPTQRQPNKDNKYFEQQQQVNQIGTITYPDYDIIWADKPKVKLTLDKQIELLMKSQLRFENIYYQKVSEFVNKCSFKVFAEGEQSDPTEIIKQLRIMDEQNVRIKQILIESFALPNYSQAPEYIFGAMGTAGVGVMLAIETVFSPPLAMVGYFAWVVSILVRQNMVHQHITLVYGERNVQSSEVKFQSKKICSRAKMGRKPFQELLFNRVLKIEFLSKGLAAEAYHTEQHKATPLRGFFEACSRPTKISSPSLPAKTKLIDSRIIGAGDIPCSSIIKALEQTPKKYYHSMFWNCNSYIMRFEHEIKKLL